MVKLLRILYHVQLLANKLNLSRSISEKECAFPIQEEYTGSYTNREGQKVYTTNVVIEEVEFCESKQSQGETHKTETREENRSDDGFVNLPEGIDDELPFN